MTMHGHAPLMREEGLILEEGGAQHYGGWAGPGGCLGLQELPGRQSSVSITELGSPT